MYVCKDVVKKRKKWEGGGEDTSPERVRQKYLSVHVK